MTQLSTQAEAGWSQSGSLLGTRIGQYEVIRLLGRGGMREVYLARDLRLGRLVAVKLLTMQQPDLDQRFLAEAQATARCHHENIVVIFEVGAHRDRPYMVLEYVAGQVHLPHSTSAQKPDDLVLADPGAEQGAAL